MRYAIFSDIHNNRSALALVLSHAKKQGVDGYFCLGDVGVNDCVALVREVNASTVFGNWEVSNWRYLSADNQNWVLGLPALRKQEGFWLTHAAPFWPTNIKTLTDLNANRYQVPMTRLFPYLHYESEAVWQTVATLAQANIPIMFHGHTHRHMVWCFTQANQLKRLLQHSISIQPGHTLIVGVGSVGRPLDGPHPGYVIYDDVAKQVELITI